MDQRTDAHHEDRVVYNFGFNQLCGFWKDVYNNFSIVTVFAFILNSGRLPKTFKLSINQSRAVWYNLFWKCHRKQASKTFFSKQYYYKLCGVEVPSWISKDG